MTLRSAQYSQIPRPACSDDRERHEDQEYDEQRKEDELESLTGIRWRRSSPTSVPCDQDVPKSPDNARFSQIMYCCGIGQIEMQLAPQRLDSLFGCQRAELKARRIAGEKAHQREGDERDQKNKRRPEQEPSPDIEEVSATHG